MREIKFRAWSPSMKQISEPFTLQWAIECHDGPGMAKNDVFMQFTGLKDKNGKEIYEGDIVQSTDIEIVKWADDCSGFYPFIWQMRNAGEPPLYEVIGNIYENKELLKKDEDDEFKDYKGDVTWSD